MDNPKSSEAAIQMMVWAIEEIIATGNKKAEDHARLALKCLLPPHVKTPGSIKLE